MYDDDPIQRRRQQRERARKRTLSIGLVAGGLVVAGLVVAVALMVRDRGGLPVFAGPIGGPSESSEGEDWTHKELAEYLNKKGVKVEIIDGVAGLNGEINSYFVDARYKENYDLLHDRKHIIISLCKDRKTAKETAASAGSTAFSWGRFVIPIGQSERHKAELSANIKSVLKPD